MAKRTTIGLDSVLLAPILPDGSMGTAFTEIGVTVLGTATITKAAPTTTEIGVEETETAEFVSTTGGAYTVAFSSYNVDPDVMVMIFGGTATGTAPNKVWNAPISSPSIELSIRMISKTGYQVDMARVQLTPDFSLNFQKETPGQINVVGTVLSPTKVGVPPLIASQVAVG